MSEIKLNSKIFDAVACNSGSSVTSEAIKVKLLNPEGFFSLQVTQVSTGTTGTTKFEVLCSNDGTTFIVPEDKAGTAIDEIVTAHADGTKIYAFPAFPVCKEIKIKATASVANVTSLTAIICIV